MMGVEVLGEKKNEGVILTNESAASPEQPEDEEDAKQTAQDPCIPDSAPACDPGAAEPSR